ncbi:MAG: glycoside hydrolase family 2 protein [Clostridiales bacterium]|nr:glycoside hydrolase family 2 protein [Clostridiales bacterium]
MISIPFNTGWTFYKSESAPGEPVTLPHTWNAVDGQDGGNDYYRGTCTYVNTIPALSGEVNYIQFDGAAHTTDVFLNGRLLAHHEGGYSAFRVALPESGELRVQVDNGDNTTVYPQKADFTFYGGLYRGVKLLSVHKTHFALCGLKVTPVIRDDLQSAVVALEARVENGEGQSVHFSIGDLTADATVKDGVASAELVLNPVRLWNGKADPYLYTATARVAEEEVSVRFGCRKFVMDPQRGFLLNGKEYPLRGVSRHQDWADLGSALTMEQHRQDMAIIKEIGATTVRLAHYQQAQEFYDLCDEEGIVVWAEIPFISQFMEEGRENTLSQMRELVEQNYNHPSIVCWGLSNEITVASTVNEPLLENHRALNDLCHSLDGTRPTVMAHAFMLEMDSPILEIPDMNSYNLYFGWYLGELEQNDKFFDEYHAKYPDRIIGFSEYGADANPAFQSSTPQKGEYTESYQCVYHEHMIEMIEKRPYLWATHVWNLFDFAADGRDEGGKHGVNQKGLVSFDRKLKKDAFYLYKAHWNQEEPFVHLCGSRYVDRAEDVTEVKVYSNQPTVTLMVDGKAVERKTARHIFNFSVPIQGEHTVQALSGDCTDTMVIRKVSQPNPAYRFGTAGDVTNWFDKDTLKPDCYSIKDTFGELISNPGTAPIVGRMMAQAIASRGDVAKSTSGNQNLMRMMAGLSLESLIKQAGDSIKPEQIRALNEALQKIKK